jgi:oxygen tolerance protein BatD
MVRRFCAVLSIAVYLLFSAQAYAAVSAQLSAQNIDELETVRLTIKINETRQTETLDLSALETDFHVLSTNTVSQSRFLNGRGVSWVDYQITLQPKRTGTLKIPSITVGNEPTPTLELKVRPLSATTRQTIDELVFFENEVSAKEVYVQSQLILTRRLLYSQGVQLYSDLPGAPEISDAVVLTLGETRSDTTTRNGKTYGLVEQRYAIYPEVSGRFELPGINITASVRLIENGRVSRKGVRVGTQTETISVLPVPDSYPADAPWLPATNVELMDVISPDRPDHEVGDTLKHELLIYIHGNIGSMSPPLPITLNENEFRVYPAAPVIEDDTRGETVKGSRLQTNSIVPLQPGSLSLPPTEVIWWDTESKQVRISTTPERTLNVSGAAVVDPLEVPGTDDKTNPVPDLDNSETDLLTESSASKWIIVVLMMVVTAFASIFAWFYYRRRRQVLTNRPRTASQCYRAFNEAIAAQDATTAIDELKQYLSRCYSKPEHLALAQFRHTDAEADSALNIIDQHFYQHPLPENQLDEAFNVLQRCVTNHRTGEVARSEPDALPPLYAGSI